MKRPRTLWVAAAWAGLVVIVGAWVPWRPTKPNGRTGGPAVKAEQYVVVQNGDDLEVMTRSEFLALKKSATEKYKQDMKDYKEAVKQAKKNKEKFDGPKPVKVEPKQVGSSYKTKEEADTACEKRKRDKDEGKGDQKPAKS